MICKIIKLFYGSKVFLKLFFSCLSVLYADDYQFIDDYKITLKTIPFEPSANALAQMQSSDTTDNQEINSSQFKRYQHYVTKTTYPLHTQQLTFYCLSPSVAFSKDLKLARS